MCQQELNLNNLVKQMNELISKKDKHLFTPEIMKMCLRARDYDIDKAYSLGIRYVERFKQCKIKIESKTKLNEVLNSSIIRVCCCKGETVIIFDLCSWNSKKIADELIPATLAVVLNYLLRDELVQINGCYILFDIIDLKLKHLSQIRKKLIEK